MPTLQRRKDSPPPRRHKPNKAFYQSSRWHKYSISYRKKHPLCVLCLAEGKTTRSQEVDHIIPIQEGGEEWNPDNHQALCKTHHSQKTAKENKNWNKRE
jgi:5-methylcytosine-specific restriction endonuclease McrA